MHPLETSSVISEPIEGGAVSESTTTTSTSLNKLPQKNTEEEIPCAKHNRLKSCIIRLTELSSSDCEKWLTGESSSQTGVLNR